MDVAKIIAPTIKGGPHYKTEKILRGKDWSHLSYFPCSVFRSLLTMCASVYHSHENRPNDKTTIKDCLAPLQIHLTLKMKSNLTLRCVYLHNNKDIIFRTKAFHMPRFKTEAQSFSKKTNLACIISTHFRDGMNKALVFLKAYPVRPCLSRLCLTPYPFPPLPASQIHPIDQTQSCMNFWLVQVPFRSSRVTMELL